MPIALLTDFGTRDPYVAAMKGVIVSRTDVAIADLTHDIDAFDVLGAAWFLRNVVDYWPARTIFVCVVDPGVGSARRIIAVERKDQIFLAPDNGLLAMLDARAMYSVENASLFLPDGSNTFHGRDRFAPVAAALANGMSIEEVGPRIDAIVQLDYEPPRYDAKRVRGTVVAIDRFGNVITDIEAARVPFALALERNYADAPPGVFQIVGSTGHLEWSMRNGSAAEELRMRRGQGVELTPL
jgi:S-adenosylmethionine hydrolase